MKPYTLTNREGESISPITSTKTVFDEKGVDLDTLLSQQKQDADNALKDYAKSTEVTQGLNGKQDKLSTTTDLHITDDNTLGLTELARMRSFDDMWRAVVGIRGDIDHDHYEDGVNKPYCLNKLWLTYKEALKTFEHPLRTSYDCRGYLWNAGIKTNLMLSNVGTGPVNCQNMFNNSGIVIACLPNNIIAGMIDGMFVNCGSLKEVIGIISMQSSTGQFNEANNTPCEKLFLQRINRSLKMQFFYKLNLESWQYMVSHAINTLAITITVHPNIYAKLTGDTSNAAAAELTEEELAQWRQVLTDAVAKNISFATV